MKGSVRPSGGPVLPTSPARSAAVRSIRPRGSGDGGGKVRQRTDSHSGSSPPSQEPVHPTRLNGPVVRVLPRPERAEGIGPYLLGPPLEGFVDRFKAPCQGRFPNPRLHYVRAIRLIRRRTNRVIPGNFCMIVDQSTIYVPESVVPCEFGDFEHPSGSLLPAGI
jgi:hypothetical protein